MIGTVIGHYRIASRIGAGGMGEIYLADDLNLKRKVALKFLRSGLTMDTVVRARFQREAEAAAQLSSPNIVTVYEIGDHDGVPYIAMEFIEGVTLQTFATSHEIPHSEAISIVLGIARGLEKAHKAGITHRDIKPANVLIDTDGHPRILDFGVAQIAQTSHLTASGHAVGTLAYMSPEQIEGEEVDNHSDIWSLGVILYELIAHRRPFAGNRVAALTYEIVNAEPFPLSRVSPGTPTALDKVIQKCLAKRPSERYSSIAELINDLNDLTSTSILNRKSRPARSRAWPIAVSLAALLAASYLFWSMYEKSKYDSPVTLVVAPFTNLGYSEHEYFADGLTDELSTRIGHLKNISVISYASAMTFKNQSKTSRDIGTELGADYVLEGTVRWQSSGNEGRIRITPRLVKASDNHQLWSETYERDFADVFGIQSDISEKVARSLNVVLFADDQASLQAKPTADMQAYDLFLQANGFFNRSYSRTDIEESIRLFGLAVQHDASFVAAWARLSWAHSRMYWFGHDQSPVRLELAKDAVDRAVALDPESAECHIAMGYVYYWGYRDYPSALREFYAAKERIPSSSDVLEGIGYVLRRQGHIDSALVQIAESFRLDPKSSRKAFEYGNTYYRTRHWREADSLFVRASKLNPHWSLPYSRRAALRVYSAGDLIGARAVIDSAKTVVSPTTLAEDESWLESLSGQLEEAFLAASLIEDSVYRQIEFGRISRFQSKHNASRAHFDTARVWLERILEAEPENAAMHRYLALVYAGMDRCADAHSETSKSIQLMPLSEDAFFGGPSMLEGEIEVLAMCGDRDGIIDKIRHILELPTGLLTPEYLAISPQYKQLNSLPAFESFLREGSPSP